MQYIILSGGKGTRWNNYMGVTKQEAIIGNERIIDRICRLLQDNNQQNIKILSRNPNHSNSFSTRIESNQDRPYKARYAYDFLTEETTFLYGDTYYEESAIQQILFDNPEDVRFYGNETAIVGVKVIDVALFKRVIDSVEDQDKPIYSYFKKLDEKNRWKNIGRTFVNINTPQDFERLKKQVEEEKKMRLIDE